MGGWGVGGGNGGWGVGGGDGGWSTHHLSLLYTICWGGKTCKLSPRKPDIST